MLNKFQLLSSLPVQLKDYYIILGLPPSASADEIKKAYRKLAHRYHPDKKNNDSYAAARFAEIKEAYEILSNPVKKDYYLQQRWYAQSIGNKMKQETVTPVALLKQMLELDRRSSTLDMHRMSGEGLYNQLTTLLSDDNIAMLNSFNEPVINTEIVEIALKTGNALSYRFIVPLTARLRKIKTEQSNDKKFERFIRKHKQMNCWEKKKIWIVIILVLLICLLIFLNSN